MKKDKTEKKRKIETDNGNNEPKKKRRETEPTREINAGTRNGL